MRPKETVSVNFKTIRRSHRKPVRTRINYPDDAVGCWDLGKHFNQDGNTRLARRCFRRAMRLDPGYRGYLLDLGQWLRDKGLCCRLMCEYVAGNRRRKNVGVSLKRSIAIAG